MAKCKFTTKYWNYESKAEVPFDCDSENEDVLPSGLCIFHDIYYLQDYLFSFREEKNRNVREKLMDKVSKSRDKAEALFCIGYYLPDTITIQGDFTKPVYFSQAKLQRIDFSTANFSGEADFGRAKFSGKANFNSAKFFDVYFDSAQFSGEADFGGTKFSGSANFISAEFFSEARFGSAKFSEVHFASTKFSGRAIFTSAKFSGKANFYSAKFFDVYFDSAQFSGEADFGGAKFSGSANFNSAEFSGEADFYSALFSEIAGFYSANFFRKAIFFSAKFSEVHFNSAKFCEKADFGSAKFYRSAYFTEAEFSREANFLAAIFSETAGFFSAEFSREAIFIFASFSEVHFASAKFCEKADFGSAKFYRSAYFTEAEFSREANFSGTFKDKVYFNYVLFEDAKKILFGIEDLSQFSFMNTDITRVRFSDRARWGEEDKFKVVEEEMLENSLLALGPPQQVSLGSVMAVYRNLRENYEYRLRYDEAGKFFMKEMELKRKYKEREEKNTSGSDARNSTDHKTIVSISRNGWLSRNLSLTGMYYHFSNYGESIVKPAIIGAVTVGLSTLFWLIQNNPTAEPSLSLIAKNSPHMSNFINMTHLWVWNSTHSLKAFERSFADFLPLLPLGSGIKIGVIDYVIKIVGGVLTFGLLAIALRRKFERKYTR